MRKLALQTGKALKEIAALIAQIQSETESTVRLMERANQLNQEQGQAVAETEKAFQLILNQVETASGIIHQVAGAMQEMVEQKERIVAAVEEMQQILLKSAAETEEVTASVQSQTQSMERLNHLAEELESHAQQLREELQKFKIDGNEEAQSIM